MIFTAFLFSFTFILAGFITGASPRTLAGFEDLPGDAQRSEKARTFARQKKTAFILAGCFVLAGSIVATLTGIQKIYEWSLFAPSALLLVFIVYKGYALSGYRRSFFKMSRLKTGALIFAVALPVLLIAYFSREIAIDIDDKEIRFGGLYGETVPIDDIKTIEWKEAFPAVRLRTNGFALGPVCVGYFKIKNTGLAKLFVYAPAPLIRMETGSRVYYFNARNPELTARYYRTLLDKKARRAAPARRP